MNEWTFKLKSWKTVGVRVSFSVGGNFFLGGGNCPRTLLLPKYNKISKQLNLSDWLRWSLEVTATYIKQTK